MFGFSKRFEQNCASDENMVENSWVYIQFTSWYIKFIKEMESKLFFSYSTGKNLFFFMKNVWKILPTVRFLIQIQNVFVVVYGHTHMLHCRFGSVHDSKAKI